MREKELKLTQELLTLQKQFNAMVAAKDEWRNSYCEMKKERDRYLEQAMALERYMSDNGIDRDLIE